MRYIFFLKEGTDIYQRIPPFITLIGRTREFTKMTNGTIELHHKSYQTICIIISTWSWEQHCKKPVNIYSRSNYDKASLRNWEVTRRMCNDDRHQTRVCELYTHRVQPARESWLCSTHEIASSLLRSMVLQTKISKSHPHLSQEIFTNSTLKSLSRLLF